eukprot:1157271-Pelagomonas_calceolata.AAC.19
MAFGAKVEMHGGALRRCWATLLDGNACCLFDDKVKLPYTLGLVADYFQTVYPANAKKIMDFGQDHNMGDTPCGAMVAGSTFRRYTQAY